MKTTTLKKKKVKQAALHLMLDGIEKYMQNNICFYLYPNEGPGSRSHINLTGLTELLINLYPDRILLEFSLNSRNEISLYLEVWPRESDLNLINSFRKAIIKLEGQSGFQAVSTNIKINEYLNWIFIQPTIDEIYFPSGNPIALDISLLQLASQIFKTSILLETNITYRIDLIRTEPQPEIIRPLIPTLAELHKSTGSIFHSYSDKLHKIFQLARQEGWHATEIFGLAPGQENQKRWIEENILISVKNQLPNISKDIVNLKWTSNFTSLKEANLFEYIQGLRSRCSINSIIEAFSENLNSLSPLSSPNNRPSSPNNSEENYIFISYAHKNTAAFNFILKNLELLKIPFWYDAHITPGSVWDDFLEKKIDSCSAFIAYLTDEYQNSKYCRREIKYADFLSKPIIPFSIDPINWSDGLRLMFQELQIYNLNNQTDINYLKNIFYDVCPILRKREI